MQEKSVTGIGENQCCGCGACRQVCPKQCISEAENQRGFRLPVVDSSKCISCGLCRRVCPEINTPNKNSIMSSYIARAAKIEIQNKSTSGGVFSLLAEAVLDNGGVVFGCAWTDDLRAHHIRIEDKEELSKLQQSKYVQSDTEETFSTVKDILRAGRIVLYSGTGCQLAGLKNVLGDNDHLILVEVACHGVPSPGLFREYIRWFEEKRGKNITGYQFRNRKKHKKGEHYQLRVDYSNGSKEYIYSCFDPYYASFLSGRTLRETCYDCKYKGDNRVGDILLADYWGCEKEHSKFDATQGASAIVCTSSKGLKLIQAIESGLNIQVSDWNKVVAHNKSLVESAQCSPHKRLIDAHDIDGLKPKVSIKSLISIYTPEKIKYLIKRI